MTATWPRGAATLLDLVLEARARVTQSPPASVPFSVRAEVLACDCWGPETPTLAPQLANVAGLALASRERLVAHDVRPAAAAQVGTTDMHSLPAGPPRLLQGPWLLQVRRPEAGERLWGDTVALGGYEVDGTTYLVGLGAPDWCAVATWRPRWTGEDLESGTQQSTSPLVDDVSGFQAWAREAARYAVVLGLLLDAEGAPLRVEEERQRDVARRASKGGAGTHGLSVRHVYLDEERVARAPAGTAVASDADGTAGRLAEQVQVRGHLKRQRHGPGNREVKWVYVAGYSARRWIAPGVSQVVVAT